MNAKGETPMAEIRYLDNVTTRDGVAGHGCYICGRNSGGIFNMDVAIEGEGVLAICEGHIKQAATFLGLTDPLELEGAKQFANELRSEIVTLRDRLSAMQGLVHSFAHYFRSSTGYPVDPEGDIPLDEQLAKATAPPEPDPEQEPTVTDNSPPKPKAPRKAR